MVKMSVGIGAAPCGPGAPARRPHQIGRPGRTSSGQAQGGGRDGAGSPCATGPEPGGPGVSSGPAESPEPVESTAPAAPAVPAPGTSPADPALGALAALARHERVLRAEEAVRQASAELRWHGALRRRWREARAEASIRGAVASASIEGVVLPAGVLREHVAAASLDRVLCGDPGLDATAGLWRAGARVVGWMPDLVGRARPELPSARALLTSLHRDITGPLASSGRIDVAEVALPRSQEDPREGGPATAPTGEELRERLEGLLALIGAAQAPALVRAAVVHAEMVTARPFSAGNAAVGRLLVRHLITTDGLEPTGTAVSDLYAARAPGAYADAAAAYASGTPEGVVAWVEWQAEAILVGIQEAGELCRAVQAGTWQAG